MKALVVLGICSALVMPLWADQEAGNSMVVRASEPGRVYLKSEPADRYGTAGVTRVYRVTEGDRADVLLNTYDWFSNDPWLAEFLGGTVVQFGPWARGNEAKAEDLAIAFYRDGKLIKSYSTLDLAGAPGNVSASVSHYTVIEKILGFRAEGADGMAFEVESNVGTVLAFDLKTGALRPGSPKSQVEVKRGVPRATDGANFTYVRAPEYGIYYAKSIPARADGTGGSTRIMWVNGKGAPDTVMHTYNWYSPDVQLHGGGGTGTTVRLGTRHPGPVAPGGELELAFYREGKLLKSYTTRDLTITRLIGFRWIASNDYVFEVEASDEKVVGFDLASGERVQKIDYAHAEEHDFQDLRVGLRESGVPLQKAIEAYELRDVVGRESWGIAYSTTLTREQKQAQLKALAERIRAQVLVILGEKIGERFVTGGYDTFGIRDLLAGRAVRFTETGRTTTSF